MGIIKTILLLPFTFIKFIIKDLYNDYKTVKRVFIDLSEHRNPMPEENRKALLTGWGGWFKSAGWMYLIIFAAFYFAGYAAATNDLQDSCNEFIIEEYAHCRVYEGNFSSERTSLFIPQFNITEIG